MSALDAGHLIVFLSLLYPLYLRNADLIYYPLQVCMFSCHHLGILLLYLELRGKYELAINNVVV